MKPGLTLYEEDEQGNLSPFTPALTATQRYLWDIYQRDIQGVVSLAAGDRILVFHVGDLTQGHKYKEQLVSTRLADQIIIAEANVSEWLAHDNVEAIRLASGTGSHIFGESSGPILVAEMIRGKWKGDIRVVMHGLAKISGVDVDYAHHGPSAGIREWTAGNQLRYYLRSIMRKSVASGRLPPRLVVRGHFHEYWPETDHIRIGNDWYTSDIVLLPSYCGMGEYGRQATQSKYVISNGLVAAEIVDGELVQIHAFERSVDLRTVEEL